MSLLYQVPRVISSPNLGGSTHNNTKDPFADFTSLASSLSNQNLFNSQPKPAVGQPMGMQQASVGQPMGMQGTLGQPMGMRTANNRSPMTAQTKQPSNNLLGDFDVFGSTKPNSSNNSNNNNFGGVPLLPASNGNLMGANSAVPNRPGMGEYMSLSIQSVSPSVSFFSPLFSSLSLVFHTILIYNMTRYIRALYWAQL